MKTAGRRVFLTVMMASMLVLHLFLAWKLRDLIPKGYPDFTIFYSAGKIIDDGKSTQLYDERTQYDTQRSFAPDVKIRLSALPYNHPPFEALLFVPFTKIPYFPAYLVWNAINLFILGYLPSLLRPHISVLKSISNLRFLLISLAFFPIFMTLVQGQDSILLLLLFAAVYVLLKENKGFQAGCCLALGLFRFQFILLVFLWLLWRRRKQACFGFVLVAVGLGVVSIASVGLRTFLYYPFYVWQMESRGAGVAIVPLDMPNLHGLFTTILGNLTGNTTIEILVLLGSLGLILLAATKIQPVNFELEFSSVVIITVLVSYHSYEHDLSLLLLPVLFVTDHLRTLPKFDLWTRISLVGPILVVCLSPLYILLRFGFGRLSLLTPALLLLVWGLSREIAKDSGRDVETGPDLFSQRAVT